MVDLDELVLAKLAREMVMNIRNYQAVFDDYGITPEDYYEIEKNEFYKKVKEQFAIEWNSALSTKDRLRLGSQAYLEQILPSITRRALRETENLSAATEVGKLLERIGGVGEKVGEKPAAERFVIQTNLGGETETYDKAIDVTPDADHNPAMPSLTQPRRTPPSPASPRRASPRHAPPSPASPGRALPRPAPPGQGTKRSKYSQIEEARNGQIDSEDPTESSEI